MLNAFKDNVSNRREIIFNDVTDRNADDPPPKFVIFDVDCPDPI